MPAHIVRLLILMVVIVVVGVIARSIFIAESFGDYGHYRGDSVAEIAAQEPAFKGPEYCSMCHTDRHAEWTAVVIRRLSVRIAMGPPGNTRPPVSYLSHRILRDFAAVATRGCRHDLQPNPRLLFAIMREHPNVSCATTPIPRSLATQ